MTSLNDFCNRNQNTIDNGLDGDTGPVIRKWLRWGEMCMDAIGQEMTVVKRIGPNRKMKTKGVIIKAEAWRLRVRRCSFVVQFKVVMVCGPKEVEREFFVEKLPS